MHGVVDTMAMVEGVGAAMAAAEEASTAAVEQAYNGWEGDRAVYFVLINIIYCRTAETNLCYFLSHLSMCRIKISDMNTVVDS